MTKRKIMTRREAARRGLSRYFTKPCRAGHTCGRYTISAKCIECLRLYNAKPAARKRRARYETTPACQRIRKRYRQSPAGIASNRRGLARYNKTPKGREAMWRYRQSPKGHERDRRFKQSPKGREHERQQSQTPKGRDKVWRRNHSAKGIEYRRKWGLDRRLKRIEAAYNAKPTLANWTRLQNLYARRRRDGR
jgi:hypothetical protein